MAVRNTTQLVAPSGNAGGLILSPNSDIKFWDNIVSGIPWGLDATGSGGLFALWLGDQLLGGPRSRGGISMPVFPAGGWGAYARAVSGVVAVTLDDHMIAADSSGGNVTINLPTAASCKNQIFYITKNAEANTVTIQAAGAELIDGWTSYILYHINDQAMLYSDGSNWLNLWHRPTVNDLETKFAPAYTNTAAGGTTTIATVNRNYSGYPCEIFWNGSGRDVNAADEFMQVNFYFRIDGGADNLFSQWTTNKANDRRPFIGIKRIRPLLGARVLDIRCSVGAGAGTFTIDGDDFTNLSTIDLVTT